MLSGFTIGFTQDITMQDFSSYMQDLNEAKEEDFKDIDNGDYSMTHMKAFAAKYNLPAPSSNSYNSVPSQQYVPTERHCYTWYEYYTPPTYGYGVARTIKIPHTVCN